MKIFNLINIGVRAGSGVPNIFNIWADEGWEEPIIEERFDPDRTILMLSFLGKLAKKSGGKVGCEKEIITIDSDNKQISNVLIGY
jgi:ATP-dependent DNA helicase RecG